MNPDTITTVRGGVWLPVDAEDGDTVQTDLVVTRTDVDEITLTLRPDYEAEALNVWLSRQAAATLIGVLAEALAAPEGGPFG